MSDTVDLTGVNPLSALFETSETSESEQAAANASDDTDSSESYDDDATVLHVDLEEGARQWARDEVAYIRQRLYAMAIVQVLDSEQYAHAVGGIADNLAGAASAYANASGDGGMNTLNGSGATASSDDSTVAASKDDASSSDGSANGSDADSTDSDANGAALTANADPLSGDEDSEGAVLSAASSPSPPRRDDDGMPVTASADDDAEADDDETLAGNAEVSRQIAAYLAMQTPSDRDDAFMAEVKHLTNLIKTTFRMAVDRAGDETGNRDWDTENHLDLMRQHMTGSLSKIDDALSKISGNGADDESLTAASVASATQAAVNVSGPVDLKS